MLHLKNTRIRLQSKKTIHVNRKLMIFQRRLLELGRYQKTGYWLNCGVTKFCFSVVWLDRWSWFWPSVPSKMGFPSLWGHLLDQNELSAGWVSVKMKINAIYSSTENAPTEWYILPSKGALFDGHSWDCPAFCRRGFYSFKHRHWSSDRRGAGGRKW